MSERDLRSRLPAVHAVLERMAGMEESAGLPVARRAEAVRAVLDTYRKRPQEEAPDAEEVARLACALLYAWMHVGLRRAVNATGIVLHTNLGRAVLPREAMDAVARLDGCCTLQIELEGGGRGARDVFVEHILRQLTGCEAATVVNNNAAATLLVLAALCKGREVVVSRGQLIEIGGSFRLPDVIAESGAVMVEVGATNKTHLRDYANAIGENTAALLRVNPSNYRIVGFSQSVSTKDLCGLKANRELLVMDDLGCGALLDLSEKGLPREPTVQESLAAGADVAFFSGDKLIGGPQCGIIVGRRECIQKIRKHPLARALRVGKFTIAALEATLKLFLDPDTVWERNPTLRMLALTREELRPRAEALAARLLPLCPCEVVETESASGGGAMPDTPLPSCAVALRHPGKSAEALARGLRLWAVVARIHEERVLLDARTLLPGDEERIEVALSAALAE